MNNTLCGQNAVIERGVRVYSNFVLGIVKVFLL